MAMTTKLAADGNIELMFLQQMGRDPFVPKPERTAQVVEVASRIARFIGEAATSIDIAIYDWRLHDEPAAILSDALRERAKSGVAVRIVYDGTIDAGADASVSPAHLEADKKPAGTESFVRSLSDVAQIRAISGYRVLMHSKYIVRDANSAAAAVFIGSSNYTNDSWGSQENNLVCLRSQLLASYFARNFVDLLSSGRITEATGAGDGGNARIAQVPVTVAFAPGDSPLIVKEIVGAITAARSRLYVASVVMSSGPILAALSEAIDRGLPLAGLYDGPQMDQVERQWKAAHVGADKVNTWQKICSRLVRKNSIPYDRSKPHQPHNFMHNKLVIADDAVVTGSFNLSNHAMGNAENVVLMRDAEIASIYEVYIRQLIAAHSDVG
jgi:phosphatidylserine/phosphatidylglycerophosphate/cardiolipin synthase-like enzyme